MESSQRASGPFLSASWTVLHGLLALLCVPFLWELVQEMALDEPAIANPRTAGMLVAVMPLLWVAVCALLAVEQVRRRGPHLELPPRAARLVRLLLLLEALVLAIAPQAAMWVVGAGHLTIVFASALLASLAMMLRSLVAQAAPAIQAEPPARMGRSEVPSPVGAR